MVWNLSIRCSPDRLEIDRRVAGLGKVTGIAFLIAGGLGALGSLGSGSIVGFLFALAWAACGFAIARVRFSVLLDGKARQITESMSVFRQGTPRTRPLATNPEITLSERRVSGSARGAAPMVTRAILGSHFYRANLEDSVGKVVLAEFSSIDETLEVARKAAAVLSLKIKDEGMWVVKRP